MNIEEIVYNTTHEHPDVVTGLFLEGRLQS